MSQPEYVIPKGSIILVTGANGYIASHIIDILLEIGFKVRGTVRSEKPWLDKLFSERHGKGKYHSVVVPDLSIEGAYDQAIKDVAAVAHVASDVSLSADPNEVIPKVVNLAINALTAASKESSVKRFVLTSSAAATYIAVPENQNVIVDETSYNDSAVKSAWDDNTAPELKPFYNYAASKTESERESWKWVNENKPGFIFNSVLPGFNMGTILHSEQTASTMGVTRNLLKGDPTVRSIFAPEYFIDVRDTARLHIAALLDSSIKDERIFGSVQDFNWTYVDTVLRKLRPNNKNIPEAPADDWRDKTVIKPMGRAEEILKSFWGKTWTGFEESLSDGIAGWD
ncbi:hypothetical protein BGW36DRAFT_383640 [Talaromyces proteolyticus]|uniref:NAD-dependent epimerase/dehydratase domain-containing protein n=1 Tax=Talaromyces proteolyticus TaxID=1131652 RepID=A0AAD4KR48_9EURO|nr:uncharacterized protein BGW36DRAFT_383640 [Talaromyces proteolyticus]KAH8693752.1 hypothetical protein BGW36DRAFT_383640 [Talaromyces proteolyticus]